MDIDKEYQTEIHNKHEKLTEEIYNTPSMLPNRYVYILTNLCNLNCSWCFMDRDYRKDNMNPEDWINLSKQLPDYARVGLTGGEPLIYPGFKKVFSYVAEKHDCNVISNGLPLTRELSDFLLSFENFGVLGISVDNIGNTIRGVKSERWKKVEDQLRYFSEKKKKVHPDCILDIKTMALDRNADEIFDIYKYCVEELNCDTHVLQFLKGSPLQHADSLFEFEDIFKKTKAPVYEKFDTIKQQVEKIKKYNQENKKISFLHPKVDSLISRNSKLEIDCLNEPFHVKENYMSCKYPWSSVHINVDGNLFSCLAISIGNVKEKPLAEIINGEEMGKFRNIIKKEETVEACNRCGWLKFKAHKKND